LLLPLVAKKKKPRRLKLRLLLRPLLRLPLLPPLPLPRLLPLLLRPPLLLPRPLPLLRKSRSNQTAANKNRLFGAGFFSSVNLHRHLNF
jgi:hypothetical protein